MRVSARSPAQAIAPPAYVANKKIDDLASAKFHCCHKVVNRASRRFYRKYSREENEGAEASYDHRSSLLSSEVVKTAGWCGDI